MIDTREKTVRVISVDKRYVKQPYPAIAIWDQGKHCYLTGQHIDPSIAKTRGNLTVEEMTGKKMLSEEKLAKFPYIINPENTIPIIHMKKLNISVDENGQPVNHVDMAMYIFIKHYCSFVAPSKKAVRPGTDFFYIEDLETEAEEQIRSSDLRFEAEKYIREKTSLQKLKDIALMLNYKIKNFSIPVDSMSETRIKGELLKICEKDPKAIISCFDKGSNEELYIYKLVKYGILEQKNGAFFDGAQIIGTNVDNVKIYMKSSAQENQKYVSKWGKLILEKEGKLPTTPTPPNTEEPLYKLPAFENLEEEVAYIENSTFDILKKYAGVGKKYKGADWKELEETELKAFLIEKLQDKK
jgi:hypothetical protein